MGPVGESEVFTRKITVTPEMSREDVATKILGAAPWRDGHYKGNGGFIDHLVLTRDMAVPVPASEEFKLTFNYGDFGKASDRVAEKSGKENFNVEVKCEFFNNEVVDHGVMMDDGRTFYLENMMGLWTLEWISDGEAEALENDGDPIDAPPNHYKVEPERQGRLIWITGPPGFGKSTTAQLLSREHGYVYYEGDCFSGLRNPYIPPDVESPSLAQMNQKMLVGEGVEERREVCHQGVKQFEALMKGDGYEVEPMKAFYKEMCRDIKRERARIGGNWAIATVISSRSLRDLVRQELGPELEIAVVEMTLEQQVERIRKRHKGNEQAVDMLKTFYDICDPAEENEPNTLAVKVTTAMTPHDVMNIILNGN